MRLTICIAGALAVAACSQRDETPATANLADNDVAQMNVGDTNMADANMAGSTDATGSAVVTANGSTPGTFDVTAKDGKKSQTILMADGTYRDLDASGKETNHGTWNVTDGKTCFDPTGESPPTCYAESPVGADGTFTATPDKGDPVTVKKSG